MNTKIKKYISALMLLTSVLATSCIEPPLHLPAQEVKIEMSIDLVVLNNVWNLESDWEHYWYYGWDNMDRDLWGDIAYPTPTSYEARRYFLGEKPGGPHTNVDPFTVYGNSFRRTYEFGYYDILLWSNIDSKDGTQVVTINESDLEDVKASTTVTRGMTRVQSVVGAGSSTKLLTGSDPDSTVVVTGLYNQPEIFYSAYPRDIYISEHAEDYDYYDEQEKCWVKQLHCDLNPNVYIYLVQVIFKNNHGRVVGTSGNAALSAFSASTNVNTGHTYNDPSMVYFNTRFKKDKLYQLQNVDIIGGKYTTFGLCDMASCVDAPDHVYSGSRKDLPNYLMVDLSFYNGKEKTYQFDVTDQCRNQAHGGIITVVIDCDELDIPEDDPSDPSGSLFVPTVEDYEDVVFEIPLDYTINKK